MAKLSNKTAKLSTLVKAVMSDKIKAPEIIDMHQFCAFWGAYDVFSYFEDVVILVHGAAGCLGNRHFSTAMGHNSECDNRAHLSTNMKEQDIIFGGEQKLLECLEDLCDKYPDKYFAVITNCCTDIIGDDVEGCINMLPEDIRRKVIFMNTGGYSGNSYREGTENAFRLIAEKCSELKKNVSASSKRAKVNLFLRRWLWNPGKRAELDSIKHDLSLIGTEINEIFDYNFTVKKLENMGKADMNVGLCPFFSKGFLEYLNELSGVKYTNASAPIGVDATADWLTSISDTLGLEANVRELDDYIELDRIRNDLRRRIGNDRYCVIWNQTGDRMLALLGLAIELGMKPILVGVDPNAIKEKMCIFKKAVFEEKREALVYASRYIDEVQELVDSLDNPIIFCNDDYFPDKKVFRYRFARNEVYGFNGARKIYAAINEMLDKDVNRYSLFLEA